jgi:hypothetical protein
MKFKDPYEDMGDEEFEDRMLKPLSKPESRPERTPAQRPRAVRAAAQDSDVVSSPRTTNDE